ncbi:unnamed protein product [Allacma fusca]|uniref:SEC14-like protein 2 n=1 Tax=Allacma fusca TaxID=39272 RepID=A0A8J2P5G2_9HEXA|nr:unnamed protein product [Allacma fusca]
MVLKKYLSVYKLCGFFPSFKPVYLLQAWINQSVRTFAQEKVQNYYYKVRAKKRQGLEINVTVYATMDFTQEEKTYLTQLRANLSDVIGTLDVVEAHDANLLRWIKAADFNLVKAEDRFRKAMKWREETEVDNLRNQEISEFLLYKLPVFIPCGHDREGAMVIAIQFGRWKFKALLEAGHADAVQQYLIQLMERFIYFMRMESSEKKIVQTAFVVIVDSENFEISEFLSTQVFNFISDFLRLLQENYPERIKAVYAINVSKVFEIFWPLVKPLLSNETSSKVHILGGDSKSWRKALLEKIDCRELPTQYGGTNSSLPLYKNSHDPLWLPRAFIFPKEEFSRVIIRPGKTFMLNYNLEEGQRISWNFKTEAYNIGFEFQFCNKAVFEYTKADSHIYLQDGLYDVVQPGPYSLVFDNSYSRNRLKIMHYAVYIEQFPIAEDSP